MVGKQNKARTTTGVGGRGEKREFPLDCDLCQQSFPKSANIDLLCTYYVPGPAPVERSLVMRQAFLPQTRMSPDTSGGGL